MSDYKRLFSYLYYYEQEIKEKNSGFVKVEIRNGQCRAQMTVKGGFLNRAPRWNIYGMKRLESGMKLWPLGRLSVKNGQGEWNTQMPRERFLGNAAELGEVAGLLVCSGQEGETGTPDLENIGQEMICATVWDDLPLFMPKEMLRAAQIQENLEQETKSQEESAAAGAAEPDEWAVLRELLEEKEAETILSLREEEPWRAVPGERLGMETPIGGSLPETDGMKEPAQGEWQQERDAESPKKKQMQAEGQKIEREEDSLQERDRNTKREGEKGCPCPEQCIWSDMYREPPKSVWEGLSCQYPKMVLTGMGNDWEILKIKPRDIGRLPRENWVYGNNSFLLHGYYRHHHLILACYKGAVPHQYYLGVPGTSRDRERVMASMFGFTNFLPAGKDGYWYTPINLGNN